MSKILTKQTAKGPVYLNIIKNLPIYKTICEYLLYFIKPEEYHLFFDIIDFKNQPSRFMYECYLTQIKWAIGNKPEMVEKAVDFIEKHGKKCLGSVHPLFVKMYHVLAQYYMDYAQSLPLAGRYAEDALNMQLLLVEKEA